jgi:hypothetical protein
MIVACGGTGSEDDMQGAVPVTQGIVPSTHPATNPVDVMPKESSSNVNGQAQATEAAPLPAPASATAPAPLPRRARARARARGDDDGHAGAAAAPTMASTGTLVPLYTKPVDPSWSAVAAAKRAHPDGACPRR